MARTGGPGLLAEQKRVLWTRWKDGQSLSDIGRALGKHGASMFGVLVAQGGIAPPDKTRSQAPLTAQEREEISRDLAIGLSFRRIAARLGRAPSTVSGEVGRNAKPAWSASASSKAGTIRFVSTPARATARRSPTKPSQQQRRWPKHRRSHQSLPTPHQIIGSTSYVAS